HRGDRGLPDPAPTRRRPARDAGPRRRRRRLRRLHRRHLRTARPPMNTQHSISVKRAYDPRLPSDGRRILIDRLWPRGLKTSAAELDEWCKDIAPSTALRQWYGHAAARFGEFRARYLLELDDPAHAEAAAH